MHGRKAGIYVHIPFCDHKCIYCDFYSITTTKDVAAYLDALRIEARHYGSQYANELLIDSIFFGGGTPSYLAHEAIGGIIHNVASAFQMAERCEITLETNPGTVTPEKLHAFREAGVNRISIGVQSFDDDDLRFLTRIHDSRTAVATVHSVREAGFDNVSIDLIFNLPGQSKEKWVKNLDAVCSLPVQHISAYSLILEKGTILNKMVLDGKVTLADDDYDAELYEITIEHLERMGFKQYEVSNFALPGYACVHNEHYWQYDNYIGLGTSAHSFAGGKRWWNYSALNLYLRSVAEKGNAVCGGEELTRAQQQSEFIMLALRSRGLSPELYERVFDEPIDNKIFGYLEKLHVSGFVSRADEVWKLTPAGYALCDEILAKM